MPSPTATSKPAKKSPAVTASKQPKPKKSEDALALLKGDHRRVASLFEAYESTRKSAKLEQIVHTICDELTIHAMLEEKEFYPVVRNALKKEGDMLDEAEVEHASLKWLIKQLLAASPKADLYDAKVTVLKEYVEHHVNEEETEMFPKVKKSRIDTVALGQTLLAAKSKLQKKLNIKH